jgi:hypothetical protein
MIVIEPSVVVVHSAQTVIQSDQHVQSDEPVPHAPVASPPDSLRAPPALLV